MEDATSNGISDWEHLLASSTPPPPATTTTTTSDDPFLSIFPPVNHEGLPASSPPDHSHHRHTPSTPTTSTAATTSSPSLPTPPRIYSCTSVPSDHQHSLYSRSSAPISPLAKWIQFAFHLLNSKFASSLSSVRSRVLLLSSPSESPVSVGGLTMGASLMALGVWIWWKRRPRRPRGSSGDRIERLNLLIREKDEKIIELLNQVAQLNKLLLARYRVRVVKEC